MKKKKEKKKRKKEKERKKEERKEKKEFVMGCLHSFIAASTIHTPPYSVAASHSTIIHP